MTEDELLTMVPPEHQENARKIIESYCAGEEEIPLVIKIILGIGAWISSTLLLSFLGGPLFAILRETAMPIAAILLMGAALAVKLKSDAQKGALALFTGQCSFFMMLAGKMLLIAHLFIIKAANSIPSFIAIMIIMTAVSYPFYKNSLDRFLGAAITLGAIFLTHTLTLFNAYPKDSFFDNLWFLISPADLSALLFAFTLWVFIKRKTILFPLAYAAIVSLAFSAFDSIFNNYQITFGILARPEHSFIKQIFTTNKIILIASALVALYWHFRHTDRRLGLKAAAVLTIIMLPLNAAAIIGLSYLALGKHLKEIKLQVLGYMVFAGGLFFLYYSLSSTLLFKSYMLCAGGLLTIVAAYIYGRFFNEN